MGIDDDFLGPAKRAAEWIRSAQVQDGIGVRWLPDPERPTVTATVSPENSIYSGSAGTVLFFLEMAQATGDPGYMKTARLGADYLAESWRDLIAKSSPVLPPAPGFNLTLYLGLSGLAFVLIEAWKATGDERYREVARSAADHIAAAAVPFGAGVQWTGVSGVSSDGGIVLFLLYAAKALREDRYRALAVRAADRISETARHEPEGGLSWQAFPTALLGLPKESYFPNFEGGTAGVAYVLARVHAETGEARFLALAKLGALHLQTIATVRGEAALIPYRFPDLTNLYYLGYCHGPAGTARTFFELHRITRDPQYLQWAERLAQGVIDSGVPELQTPGFWNVACQCCGSAAVIELFMGLWAASGNEDQLAFARRVARQLVSRQSDLDGKGDRWYQAWTRVKPAEIAAETGYSIGASGIATALLHVHLATVGAYRAIALPDNPFPKTRTT